MSAPPFRKLLIANRGEIAVRVIRACRELGVSPVAVYSEADADALHVRLADEAYLIGPAASSESYLKGDVILDVAQRCGAEAIHPGYGFLSENAAFVGAVEAAGIVFVGPPARAMELMGDKITARRTMEAAGVPVVPGTTDPIEDDAEVFAIAERIGFPLMIKASAGGGGKGMRAVFEEDQLESGLRGARSEAANSFGDDRVYVERLVQRPRHVEVQVLSDSHGNHLHLFERDCSVQRRHQKLVEETPCPVLDDATRAAMTAVAVQAAAAIDYEGAGTIEFLLAPDGQFYFLEMNTRLQVEHPITEFVTGVDLVAMQLRVAAGEPLPFTQGELTQTGHAIEVRLCAEDPDADFRPAPGRIESLRLPQGPWVRVDGGFYPGYEVPIFYDPMMAKLVVWGRDRADAIGRMRRALTELSITGIRTNQSFFERVLVEPNFIAGVYDTGYIAEHEAALIGGERDDDVFAAALAAIVAAAAQTATVPPEASKNAWAMSGRLRRLGRN